MWLSSSRRSSPIIDDVVLCVCALTPFGRRLLCFLSQFRSDNKPPSEQRDKHNALSLGPLLPPHSDHQSQQNLSLYKWVHHPSSLRPDVSRWNYTCKHQRECWLTRLLHFHMSRKFRYFAICWVTLAKNHYRIENQIFTCFASFISSNVYVWPVYLSALLVSKKIIWNYSFNRKESLHRIPVYSYKVTILNLQLLWL
jgi:hypothetical protein